MANFEKIYRDFKKYFVGTEDFSFLPRDDRFLYPLELDFTLDDVEFYYLPVDSDGIPYRVYSSVGKQYNPTRIAAYALANYNLYVRSGNEVARERFLNSADWFYAHSDARYEYHFDWKTLKAPWISCMAQGEAASTLIRARMITKDIKYLDHAKKSLAPFFFEISQGGVQSRLPGQSVFLEEYPAAHPDNVLNGFLYALIGLGEYCRFRNDDDYQRLFDELVYSLEMNFALWSSGSWSLYQVPRSGERLKNYCTPSYHRLQISQLKWLIEERPSQVFENVIATWEKGLYSFPTRMYAMANKVLYRMKNRSQR